MNTAHQLALVAFADLLGTAHQLSKAGDVRIAGVGGVQFQEAGSGDQASTGEGQRIAAESEVDGCAQADEDQHPGEGNGVPAHGGEGHGSGRLGCVRGLALALVQSDQRLAKFEVRELGNAPRKVADGRLLAVANRRDILLAELPSLKVGDE